MPAEFQNSACSASSGVPEEIECWSDEQECPCSACGAVSPKGHLPVACGVL